MVEFELVIDKEFQNLLPPLTDAEQQQLEANLLADRRVIDPVLYWCDPRTDKNVVIDGMHRWPIAKEHNLPCKTEPMPFKSRDEAALWILEHQLGRRNLLKPEAIRKIRGELYNRMKTAHGGDRRSSAQNGSLKGSASKRVAEMAGVSEGTVIRDGKRRDALANISAPIRTAIETSQLKAGDAEVLALAEMPKGEQQAAFRDVRVGNQPSLAAAIEAHGGSISKPATAKPDKSKAAKAVETAPVVEPPIVTEAAETAETTAPVPEVTGDPDDTAVAMAAHNRRIDAFCEGIERWAMEHKPDVEYLDKDGRWDVFMTSLRGGLLAIQEAKGKICSDCRGEGCRECLSLGFVPVGDEVTA